MKLLAVTIFAFAVIIFSPMCLSDEAKSVAPQPVLLVAPTLSPAPMIASSAPLVISQEPPVWLEKVLDIASSIPVIGPVVVLIAKWLGVLASAATILVTALLGLLKIAQSVAKMSKLASLAILIEKFANGPIMYWLAFFSIYNAKKAGNVASNK